MSAPSVSYTLDASDRITAVSGNWDGFALANAGPRACSSVVLGQPLDRFIAGDTTRMFVRTMLMSARTLNRDIYRPYRCDSDNLKRFMEMRITPLEGGQVRLTHRQLHVEPIVRWDGSIRPEVAQHMAPVMRCSMCNKVNIKGVWRELEEAIRLGHMSSNDQKRPWTFEICPVCADRQGVVL